MQKVSYDDVCMCWPHATHINHKQAITPSLTVPCIAIYLFSTIIIIIINNHAILCHFRNMHHTRNFSFKPIFGHCNRAHRHGSSRNHICYKRTLSQLKSNQQPKIQSSWNLSYPKSKSFFLGAFTGVFGSLAGLGGGVIIIPTLTSKWFRMTQHVAHGTSLFAVAGMIIIWLFIFFSCCVRILCSVF